MDICIFKRVEKKYLITEKEKNDLLGHISEHLIPDKHGKSTISSLYLDTPTFLIIRNSIEGKTYKEKLRLRSYGVPNDETKVFLEIKKKFKGVVYKRRIALPLSKAKAYLEQGARPENSQIMREIDYAMEFYGNPSPKMLIAYEREAYFVKDLPNVRLTFDSNVRYRDVDLDLEKGNSGTVILPEGRFILEVKTDGAMPIWLSHALNDCHILPASFSKYGTAYRLSENPYLKLQYLTHTEEKTPILQS